MAENAPKTRDMPARGHSTAPTFDPENPRTLRRFFQELELLFARTGTDEDEERKTWVIRYLPIDVADLAESLPEAELGQPYEGLKQAIVKMYPGAGILRAYFVRDAQTLTLRRAATAITSVQEMAAYHREFKAVTASLIKAKVYSETERDRLFIEGLREPLLTQVRNRLQLKYPDQQADQPHNPDQVLSAAEYVLTGAIVNTPADATPAPPTQISRAPSGSDLKMEDLAPFLKLLIRSAGEAPLNPAALTSAQRAAAGAPQAQLAPQAYDYRNANPTNTAYCHYCGDAGCQIRFCRHVEEDMKQGKIARNQEGKIVLANGAFVPRNIPGITMRDRVFEWYRRYPMNPTVAPGAPAAQMVLQIAPPTSEIASFHLSADERIEQLQREIFNLRNKKTVFDGVEIPSRPPRILPRPTIGEGARATAPAGPSAPAPVPQPEPVVPAVRPVAPAVPPRAPNRPAPPLPPSETFPEHPYAKAADATYAPPRVRNFGAPPAPPKEKDTAYRTQVPVHQASIAEDVYARSMKSPTLTLTPEELLSIAPEVRAKYRDAITPRRVPNATTAAVPTRAAAMMGTQLEGSANSTDGGSISEDPANVSCSGAPLLPEGVIVPDFYESYLKRLAPGHDPDELTVAKESHALRSIVGLVDNKEFVEAIIDPGSQITAMSEDVCHALHLPYDPTIVVNMQSANGEVDKSLGLVRNVPFCVADIVLYLQVHVIRNAAYDILLGRPFDVLTRSVVKNFSNAEQTLTIVCPNTDRVATVPTLARGRARFRASDPEHPLGQSGPA